MKKITLLSALIVTSVFANAQIKKGAIIPGGQLGYNSSFYEYSPTQPQQKNSNANFYLSAGKAYKDNNVFGIVVGYLHGKSENYNGTTIVTAKIDGYNAGVFYRRYKNITTDLYFFGSATASYYGTTQSTAYANSTDKDKRVEKGTGINLVPGLAYSVCKKLQLEILLSNFLSANYQNGKYTTATSNTKYHSFGISTSLNGSLVNNLGIGFQLIL